MKQTAIKKKWVFYFFVVVICVSSFDLIFEGARYIKYSILPLALILWIGNRFELRAPASAAIFAFTTLLAWMTLRWIFAGDKSLGGKDIVFVASYTIPLLLFFPRSLSKEAVFFIYSATFLILLPFHEHKSLSILESTAFAEGVASFIFGAFMIAFFVDRKILYFLAATILLLLSLKRIALLGVIVCILISVLPKSLRQKITTPIASLAISSIIAALLILLTQGALDNILQSFTSKSASALTLGRINLYSGVVADIMANPLNILLGNGPGSAYDKALVDFTGDSTKHNLHSDTLKILYEQGIVFFCIFFFTICKMQSTNARILLIYVCILFATDNVLIYVDVMFIILLLASKYELDTTNTKLATDTDRKSVNRRLFLSAKKSLDHHFISHQYSPRMRNAYTVMPRIFINNRLKR